MSRVLRAQMLRRLVRRRATRAISDFTQKVALSSVHRVQRGQLATLRLQCHPSMTAYHAQWELIHQIWAEVYACRVQTVRTAQLQGRPSAQSVLQGIPVLERQT